MMRNHELGDAKVLFLAEGRVMMVRTLLSRCCFVSLILLCMVSSSEAERCAPGDRPPIPEEQACVDAEFGMEAARGLLRYPQLMPPHPDVRARIAAQGYDSVTVVNLGRLAEWKRRKGIDQPKPIRAPVLGARPALALLVEYSDLTHNVASTPSLYSSLLFSVGSYPAPGSMRDYYQEASYGQFDLSPSLVDSAWRQTANAHSYYADNDGIFGTSDDYGFGSYPNNAQGLVVAAVTLADPYVDFSSYATAGQVQGLFIIHAGRGAETDPTRADWIWSHMWALNAYAMTVDEVTVDVYSMEPEYVYSPGDSTVGVFCHEYGHVLGLPDLYDTDYSSNGLGDWSLMASGSWNGPGWDGSSPSHPDAWSRLQFGWVIPQVPTGTIIGASIPNVEDNQVIYQLWSNGVIGSEYFLLENRQALYFDTWLPGDGLLLYHVDETASQANDWHPLVMLEQADGLWDLQYAANYGDAGDPYPGTSVNRTADASTTPSTRSYAGAETGVSIRNISDSALTMTADIAVAQIPQVLLEVHPNERGQGPPPTNLRTGGPFWTWLTPSGAGSYTWKTHRFSGSGSLWIQVCAQNYAAFQNKPNTGFGNGDTLMLVVDGTVTPTDVWGTQSGPLGGYQWKGDVDMGKRLELEFCVTGLTPGAHTLRLTASMCPAIYWIKVYDLEPRYAE